MLQEDIIDERERASGCHVTRFSDAEAAAVFRFLDTLGSANLKIKNPKLASFLQQTL